MRLIDADALIPNEVHTIIRRTATGEQLESVIYAEDIDNAPTIDAEPVRHGKWMYTGFMEVKCNNCGNVFHELEDINYCPNCGCKMDLDEVNDETEDT